MTTQYPTPPDRGDFGHPASERAQYPPMYQPPPKPSWWRRYRHWIGYPVVAIAFAAIGAASGGTDSTTASSPSPTVTVTQPAAEAPATTQPTTPAAPAYSTPKPKDIKLTVVVRSKQCFGSAGCNITYRADAGWSLMFDPSITYDVTYSVRGGEDGPVVNTMTITGDNYQRAEEEMVSTSSKNVKLTAVTTRVEAQ